MTLKKAAHCGHALPGSIASRGEAVMKTRITQVHGHDLHELGRLVNDVWRGRGSITVGSEAQGGWDSISLIARTPEQTYVLKFPALKGPHRTHPYAQEYGVMDFLFRKGLCPRPVQFGRLEDDMHTPFMMTEYVEGTIPSSLDQMPMSSLEMLRQAISVLSQLRPTGIPSYKKASDYLKHIAELVARSTKGPSSPSSLLTISVSSFGQAVKELRMNMDASCVWSEKTMHGDLQESNIVLQRDRVLLLDLGSCCVGEPLFDLAYLISQVEGARDHRVQGGVFAKSAEASKIEALVPLALASAIGWSIGFLANLEREMIEPDLVTPDVGTRVAAYVNQKMDYLRSYLTV